MNYYLSVRAVRWHLTRVSLIVMFFVKLKIVGVAALTKQRINNVIYLYKLLRLFKLILFIMDRTYICVDLIKKMQ